MSTQMEWLHFLFAGAFGACLGSFWSVLAYRIPRKQSIVLSRSSCAHCDTVLQWTALVPIFSYVLLSGKCKHCGVAISSWYLMRELTVMFCAIILWDKVGWTVDWACYVSLATLLLAISEVDFRYRIIPNRLVAGVGLIGIPAVFRVQRDAINDLLLPFFGAAILLLGLRYAGTLIWKQKALGIGDIKLIAILSLFIGWNNLWAFYLAAVAGGIWSIFGIATGRLHRASRIPFAPFITVGVLCTFLFSPQDVIAWLWGWI